MRRLMSRSALVLAAVLMMLVPTAPSVHAGWYSWSTESCNPDVQWYATENWVAYYTNSTGGLFYVWKNWPDRVPRPPSEMDIYARYGWQCGRLGAPTGNRTQYGSGWWVMTFQGGNLWYSELGYWYVCWRGESSCYYA